MSINSSDVTSGVTIQKMFFIIRSGHNRKYPSEIAFIGDDSDGKPRESCRKYGRSSEENCCRLALRSFLGVHSMVWLCQLLVFPKLGISLP